MTSHSTMKRAISIIGFFALVFLALSIFPGLIRTSDSAWVQRAKKEYKYDQWENASKVKGMELLVLDGDNKLFDSFQHVDKYATTRRASRGFFGRFAGTAERYRPPPVENWWSVAGIGDLCMIELPRGWDPGYLGPERYEEDLAKNTLLLPLDEHYAIEECKMGNLVLRGLRVDTLKEQWDIARRTDKIFYEPVPLSSSIPDLTWSLNRRPFSGWLLTLDHIMPRGSICFLQGTGLALRRTPDVKQRDGQIAISDDPYRSAEIRTKWFSSKRELLLSVVGPDHQKQTIKVDLGKSSLDWDWFLPRLAGFALLVWCGLLYLWCRRQKAKANPTTPEPQAQP